MKFVMTLLAAVIVASPAVAAPDGAKLYAEKTCNACHGPKGDKPLMPNYPKIAGQNADQQNVESMNHMIQCNLYQFNNLNDVI